MVLLIGKTHEIFEIWLFQQTESPGPVRDTKERLRLFVILTGKLETTPAELRLGKFRKLNL